MEKYEKIKSSGKLKSYTEEETKKDLILPLLEALGWNVFDRNEVSAEEHMKSRGRVDFGFYINGITKFYLEAKPFKADLDKEEYAKQAIRYSWLKGINYAVLTDFESIKVFNALADSKNLLDKLIFELSCEEFLMDFELLWLLSKESFENNLLDKYAEKHGKKKKKLTVDKKLFDDLKEARRILTDAFPRWNKNLPPEILEEGVQRILDRLVFIRVLEDRGLEQSILKNLVNEAKSVGDLNRQLFHLLIEKFRELDDIYNSSVFKEHSCEKWVEYEGAIMKVSNLLYSFGMYEYDFKEISADILGGVYESYLSYIAQNPIEIDKSGKEGKLFKLESIKDTKEKSRIKRKEQGIYYTPKFIVDYIVSHTLGEKLKEIKSEYDLNEIKILDPACGSGSFLTKALEVMNDKYKDFSAPGDQITKTRILLGNIYGVDLDPKAVELAKLNLLIDALDKKDKLPDITENIRVGNSLISGEEKELEKYFGKDWRDKKSFNWEEEFNFIKQSGFDVIIGNPPYGAEISEKEKNYFKNFDIGSSDTAILFIKKSFELLKDDGRLGFIIPKAFCFASNYEKIRNFVWDYLEIIIDCGKVWQQVKLEQVIIILKNGEKLISYHSGKLNEGVINIIGEIKKSDAKEFGFFLNGVSNKEMEIAKKMKTNSIMLNDISINRRGALLQKYITDNGDLEVVGGAEVQRFGIIGIKGKIDKKKIDSDQAYIKTNSVLVQNIVAHIENPTDHIKIISCVPDKKEYIIADTINQITINKKYSPYYIWSLLNSQLINWYVYRFIFGKAIRTMHFDNFVTARIPIPKNDKQDEIIKLAKEIIKLNKQLQSATPNSDKWGNLKKEIEKTDKEIDEKVYELYGLTEEEIRIIEKI